MLSKQRAKSIKKRIKKNLDQIYFIAAKLKNFNYDNI